jgi:RNase H
MNDAATIISTATGCTLAEAQNVVDELIAGGWTPPDTDHLPSDGAASPVLTTALPGLSTISIGDVLVAHTDGACSGNPGPGGWAVVFSQGDKAIAEYSGCEFDTTNNRMELTAVREAISHAPPVSEWTL